MRDWAAGRCWWWRLPLFLLLLAQATRPLRAQGETSFFSGIIFGAHEFGHLLWAFGGQWMSIVGGSLTQLLVPIGAAAVVMRSKDWFGVAVCGLFLATSLGELSWYIADAHSMDMDLVSFSAEGAIHDWNYLLHRAGLIELDTRLASFTRFVGWLVVLGSSVMAARLLWWMGTLKVADEEASNNVRPPTTSRAQS